jgi:hypothetical protein
VSAAQRPGLTIAAQCSQQEASAIGLTISPVKSVWRPGPVLQNLPTMIIDKKKYTFFTDYFSCNVFFKIIFCSKFLHICALGEKVGDPCDAG